MPLGLQESVCTVPIYPWGGGGGGRFADWGREGDACGHVGCLAEHRVACMEWDHLGYIAVVAARCCCSPLLLLSPTSAHALCLCVVWLAGTWAMRLCRTRMTCWMCTTERVVLVLGLDSREASLLSCCRCVCACGFCSLKVLSATGRDASRGRGWGGVDARQCTAGFVGACVCAPCRAWPLVVHPVAPSFDLPHHTGSPAVPNGPGSGQVAAGAAGCPRTSHT